MTRTTGRIIQSLIAATISTALLSATPASADGGTLKIGVPLALTGPLADGGKKPREALDLWLDAVEAQGGVEIGGAMIPVEIISYDYQSEGKRAGQLAEKLVIDDEVDVLIGPFGSGHTKVVAAVAERYQVPILACTASSVSVFDQGFRHLFGTLAPSDGVTDSMTAFFKEQMPGMETLAVYGRDDVFPRSIAKAVAASARKVGMEVVYEQLYAVGTMDHSAAMTAIRAAAPDWIYISGYSEDLILARKQMNDLGVAAPIVTMMTGPAYREFTDGLGALADGVTSSSWWHHATNYTNGIGVWPSTKAFYDSYVERYGTDPDYVHASCAAAADILVDAVQRAGSMERQAIRDALAETDTVTLYGPIRFGENGMTQARDMPVIQVQDQALKVLYPSDLAEADLAPFE